MNRTTDQWTISLPPALSRQALKLAKEESRTRSELVREALREYVTRKGVVLAARRRLAASLDAKGLKSRAAIEDIVDDGR